MRKKTPDVRFSRPVVTPRFGVRIGSVIRIGNICLLEVKHGKKTDFISVIELIEQVEGKKVIKVLFQDTATINNE